MIENGKKRLMRVCRRGGGEIAELKLATNNECWEAKNTVVMGHASV